MKDKMAMSDYDEITVVEGPGTEHLKCVYFVKITGKISTYIYYNILWPWVHSGFRDVLANTR